MHYVAQVISGEERKVAERLIGLFPTWRHELIPGYLFVEASAPPWPARYTDGVIRLLPQSDRPQPIDNDVMAVLQETCRAYEEAMRPVTRAQRFAENKPLAGMARKMVANLLASWASRVTLGSTRVEPDQYPPRESAPRGARRNHGHDARRKGRSLAGAAL